MRFYQQQKKQRLSIGHDGNALTNLIVLLLVVFVVFSFVKVIYYFSFQTQGEGPALYKGQVLNFLMLPSGFGEFIKKPWTLLTHMFVHDDVWHVISNLIWLWGFGYILQDLTGNRQLIPLFIYGGFAGAIFFLVTHNTIPVLMARPGPALGASAGVMAIAIGATTLSPGYRLFPFLNGGIPLWVLTTVFVVIDIAMITNSNPGGHLAHLGGAAMGFIYMALLKRGKDLGEWMNNFFEWCNNIFNPEKHVKEKAIRTQLFYNSGVAPYKKTPIITQQRIDEILDKISQKGYNSLSEEEKEMLKRASKEDLH